MWIRNAGLAAVTGQMAKLLRYEGKLEATLFEMISQLKSHRLRSLLDFLLKH
jgi:hypothetical protein